MVQLTIAKFAAVTVPAVPGNSKPKRTCSTQRKADSVGRFFHANRSAPTWLNLPDLCRKRRD
jgi:hypothetical protein